MTIKKAVLKKTNVENVLSVVAIFVSILALVFSWVANHKSNAISTDNLIFQKETESINRVNNIYKNIMYWWLRDVWMKIRNNELIEWKQPNFQLFVDELEGLSSLYCDGKIKEQHLNDTFKNMLIVTCQNKQVIKVYWWFKNGLSKLCNIYLWDVWMWKFYHKEKCKGFNE